MRGAALAEIVVRVSMSVRLVAARGAEEDDVTKTEMVDKNARHCNVLGKVMFARMVVSRWADPAKGL